MSESTIGNVVDRVHRMVNGSRRQTFNLLANNIDDTQTTITFAEPMEGITEGSHLCVSDEMMYVFTASTGTSSAVVRRGLFDTDGVAHSAGDLVEVDWRWFTADVLSNLIDDVRAWPEDIFTVAQTDVSVTSNDTAFDLPLTNYLYTLSIKRSLIGNDHYVTEPVNLYRVDTGLPTSSFPSGNALYVPNTRAGAGTVRLTYAAKFALDAIDTTTLLSAIPLNNTLIDAAIYGTAWRLLVQAEGPRSATESQPEPRTVADVHEGSALSTGLRYKQIRDMRLKEESERLRWQYPLRFG